MTVCAAGKTGGMEIYMDTMKKYDRLLALLREHDSLAVAFSGGVDSAFLLYASKQALGDRVTAYTAVSVFFPVREKSEADAFCREYGVRQVIVEYDPLAVEGIPQNPADRCYLCKRALFGKLIEIAKQHGIHAVAEGSNMDDMGDYRPGLRAISELKVLSPLREAQLTKDDIRKLSQAFGLPTWNKPSFACLASRLVYGEAITRKKLGMIDRAEELLLSLGFTQFRVRLHGDMARIEILPEQIPLLVRDDVRLRVVDELSALGFAYVSMDLGGYRTGSMNKGIDISAADGLYQ